MPDLIGQQLLLDEGSGSMFIETMELGVAAEETVITCEAASEMIPVFDCDPYEDEHRSPGSVSSMNSHIAYAEVANENIIQEIETYINKEASEIPVKKLRAIIPKMKMVTYLSHEEWQGKEKVKYLWENKPADWPSTVEHTDPNNGTKLTDGRKVKPKKEQLDSMFNHLRSKYLQMYKPELVVASEESCAKSTVEATIPPITMTPHTPSEVKMAPSGELPLSPMSQENPPIHMISRLRESVENKMRGMEKPLQTYKSVIPILQAVYDGMIVDSENAFQRNEQLAYIDGCHSFMALLDKIELGFIGSIAEIEQKCKAILDEYQKVRQPLVKKEVDSVQNPTHNYFPQTVVYNVQESTVNMQEFHKLMLEHDSQGPITGKNEMLSGRNEPYFPPFMEKSKNEFGVIPFTDQNLDMLIRETNISTRIVKSPDPDDENVYPLPEKLAKLENQSTSSSSSGIKEESPATQMQQIAAAQRQQSIEQSGGLKGMGIEYSGDLMKKTAQMGSMDVHISTVVNQDLLDYVNNFCKNELMNEDTSEPSVHNPTPNNMQPAEGVGQSFAGHGEMYSFSYHPSYMNGSSDSLDSAELCETILSMEDDYMLKSPVEESDSVPMESPPPRPPSNDLPLVLEDYNTSDNEME